jgi:amino acid transporter
MILGAGIYSIVGKASGLAGPTVWLSLLIAAVAATLAALSYAELSAMFPQVGGEYVYLRKAFPSRLWISNTGGLMMVLAGISTASTVAVAFSGYIQQFYQAPMLVVAILLLGTFTLINIAGIKESSWANVIFTLIEASGLVIVIYFGIHSPDFGAALAAVPSLATISASALIIFAYFGFENMVNFAEETKEPERTLPRAILLSVAISTILYVLVALSAVSLLPIEVLSRSEAPLADAIRPVSPAYASVLGAIALFATANTALISIVTTSRILYGMARDRSVPKVFSLVSSKRKTPWVAGIATFFFACALLPVGNVGALASISSFATLSAFLAVQIALITLRFTSPDAIRPFRIPFSIGAVPILPALGAATSAILLLQLERMAYLVGGGFLALLLLIEFSVRLLRPRSESERERIAFMR